MLVEKPNATRRTQSERSETTKAALIVAARELFATAGYYRAPTADVLHRAGVTSGALYHHFANKRGLFVATFEAVEQTLADRVGRAALKGQDAWESIELGVARYLRACREPEVRQIVLLDGPSVLGWDQWREADARFHLRPLAAALTRAMRTGMVERQPALPLARVLLGALTEAGLATGSDRNRVEAATLWLLRRMRT